MYLNTLHLTLFNFIFLNWFSIFFKSLMLIVSNTTFTIFYFFNPKQYLQLCPLNHFFLGGLMMLFAWSMAVSYAWLIFIVVSFEYSPTFTVTYLSISYSSSFSSLFYSYCSFPWVDNYPSSYSSSPPWTSSSSSSFSFSSCSCIYLKNIFLNYARP